MWQGYALLHLTVPLTAPQLATVKAALRAISTDTDSPWNDRILEIRPALNLMEAIVKAYFPNGQPTKAQAVAAIATALGVSQATINARLTMSIFAPDASDIYGGELAANAYIQANKANWEQAVI